MLPQPVLIGLIRETSKVDMTALPMHVALPIESHASISRTVPLEFDNEPPPQSRYHHGPTQSTRHQAQPLESHSTRSVTFERDAEVYEYGRERDDIIEDTEEDLVVEQTGHVFSERHSTVRVERREVVRTVVEHSSQSLGSDFRHSDPLGDVSRYLGQSSRADGSQGRDGFGHSTYTKDMLQGYSSTGDEGPLGGGGHLMGAVMRLLSQAPVL